MRARTWTSICIVAVLAVTGSAAFAQGHRGAGQSQSQFQNQQRQQQNFQPQQQARQSMTDQYIQNDRLRQAGRNDQYFQSQSRFNDHGSQVRGGWNEGYRDYRPPIIQRHQAPGWGFQVQLGTGFDRDMQNEYRPVTNDLGFHPSDHSRAYR
jgi:hypothetical protein